MSHARGAGAPESATGLADLDVTGPADVLDMTRAMAGDSGAMLMSSGGTTGAPKLTFVPYHQAIDRLLEEWRPLSRGDVLLNLFNAGRLWASHYYMHRLAERSHCTVIPHGPLAPQEAGRWPQIFAQVGVNAVAGTPTGLADLARGVLDTETSLPIETIIWMAEPWNQSNVDMVREAFPQARFWGNYGSVETYVIATNTPDCDLTTLHLMPDQLIEPDDRGALLTRIGSGWTAPVVRYRLGDRIAAAECRCGRPDGLRVLGRADDAVKFYGATFGIGEVLDVVHQVRGVREAQLELAGLSDARMAVSAVTVKYVGTASVTLLRAALMREFTRFRTVLRQHPQAIAIERVSQLHRVDRTNKVPPAVWVKAAAG
ncbi:AMP-binding protein [Nonomuraea sp. NPDC049714]|uniref:AMP-binding protein n=1 Tax=Nonomuraea sp. NPDC049714 TaxID=3364357 RepID=UPI003789987D